jgi:hypothetical protein
MDTSADRSAQTEDDAALLATRRLTVRAYADRIAHIVEGLDLPETFLEAERAARAITAADRIIQQLPAIPEDQPENPNNNDSDADQAPVIIKPPRRRLRVFADRLLTVIGLIPDPDSFLEGERAGRCLLATDRMLSQLYEAPKANARFPKSPAFADDLDEDDREDTPNWRAEFMAKADRYAVGYARRCGIWPDGTPCAEGEPVPDDPWRLPDSLTIHLCLKPDSDPSQKDRFPAWLMLNRTNAVTRALARRDGRWPDYSAYSDNDPEYYSISAHFDEQVLQRPPLDPPPDYKEIPNTVGFPAWLVRIVPP